MGISQHATWVWARPKRGKPMVPSKEAYCRASMKSNYRECACCVMCVFVCMHVCDRAYVRAYVRHACMWACVFVWTCILRKFLFMESYSLSNKRWLFFNGTLSTSLHKSHSCYNIDGVSFPCWSACVPATR